MYRAKDAAGLLELPKISIDIHARFGEDKLG
jgi:hypothetical protein